MINRRNLRNRNDGPDLTMENKGREENVPSTKPIPTPSSKRPKSNNDYILEEFNKERLDAGQSPLNFLPTGTSDNYKLRLLNRSRRDRGLDFLPRLPSDVSSKPVVSPEFKDISNTELIAQENELRKQLLEDPSNQSIRDKMNDINREQRVRAIYLSQSLSTDAGGMSVEGTPQSILDRTAEIDQEIKDLTDKILANQFSTGQERADSTDQLKNLEFEFELLTDPKKFYDRQQRQIDELMEAQISPTGETSSVPPPPNRQGPQEGRSVTPPQETSFDASNPDRTTNTPPATGGDTLGQLFGGLASAVNDLRKDASTGNSGLSSSSSGGDTTNRNEQSIDLPADLEDTTVHHEETTSDTIQDNTQHFEHIGASSRTNFDNNFIRFILSTILKRSLTQAGLDSNKADILGDTAMSGIGILYNNLKTGRLENDYNRLTLDTSTASSLTRPTLPLIIITAYLYLVDKETDFKIGINFITRPIIRHILSGVLGFEGEDIEYALMILEAIPNELKTAYLKQKGEQQGSLSSQEISAIGLFIDKINKDYLKRFNKELKKELFNYENKQTLYLYEMLETLNSSSVLSQISSAFNTVGELITEMKDNPYLLIQLFALLYNDIEGDDFTASNVLNQSKVDKLIYYYSNVGGGGRKPNDKIDILRDIELETGKRGQTPGLEVIENTDKVALYKTNDRYYITFRGTDTKDMKDISMNFQNFGGKDIYNNPEYNERMAVGMRYLDKAIELSRQQGIDPPIVLGYSLGSISAMTLSQLYPNIETDVYNPVLSKSQLTQTIMDRLGSSNIHFNYNTKDPISTNMKYYKTENPNLDIKEYSNNKFFNPHSIKQFQ